MERSDLWPQRQTRDHQLSIELDKKKIARVVADNEAAEVGTFDGEDDGKSTYFAVVVRNLILFENRSKLKETAVLKTPNVHFIVI